MSLEQIGVRAGAMENNLVVFRLNLIDQDPVWFNMTLPLALMVSVQGMVLTFRRQWLFVDDHSRYFPELAHFFAAFLCQFFVFFERASKSRGQHTLVVVVLIKVCPHFLGGTVPLTGNFTPEHGIPFFKSGDGFGVKAQLASFGIAVLGADGTIVSGIEGLINGSLSRRKGQNNRPFRHFTWNVNDKPATGRNGYRLRYGHLITIA